MDTRFWGPDGWKLFHTVAIKYPLNPSEDDIITHKMFYNSLQDVLPCKYCRMSYREYIAKRPVEKHLSSRESLFKWSYLMHNEVNGKLRKQGHIKYPDPPYEEIYELYQSDPYKDICLLGTCFLKSIIYNFPEKGDNERLKLMYYCFFNNFVLVYPNDNKPLLVEYNSEFTIMKNMRNRDNLKKWFYILNLNLEENCGTIQPYNIYCRDCEKYRSKSCQKDTHKGTTCRKSGKERSNEPADFKLLVSPP
jgi:hypothetical protein